MYSKLAMQGKAAALKPEKFSRFKRMTMYQQAAGVGDKNACCPLYGCRCPEFAGGHVENVIREAAMLQGQAVFEDVMAHESASVRDELTREWHFGIGLLQASMIEKLTFWKELPHVLCALASWEPDKVRWCAQVSLQKYAQLGEDVHHPLSRLFSKPRRPVQLSGAH